MPAMYDILNDHCKTHDKLANKIWIENVSTISVVNRIQINENWKGTRVLIQYKDAVLIV